MQKDRVARGWGPAFLKPWMPPMCREEPAPSVCMASVEKRIRVEQACQLQELILASLSRFQDWLRATELWVASPASSHVPFAVAKEELKKFEVLQRQIQDKLHHLESLNRQYRQLVQANSTGLQCQWLRATVQESNEGWDNLQKRAAAILKRLKYFVTLREEFEWERETVQVQLTELDLRLTDVEHFSGGSSLEKMRQLQEFQEAVQSNAEQLDRLLVSGEQLIQRSEPQDAEILEEELQELSGYCQEVFRRVFRFRRRLVSMRLVFEDEWLSDRETDVESDCFTDASPEPEVEGEAGGLLPTAWISQSTPHKAACCRHLHSCRAIWGDSPDLEWDPSVDVGGSTSHDEEDSSYCSAITVGGTKPEAELPAEHSCQLPIPVQERSRPRRPEWNTSLRGSRHRQSLALGDRACQQTEIVGFDPERIESWLGQTCMGQDKPDVMQPSERNWVAPGSEEVAIVMEKRLKSWPSTFSAQPLTGPGRFARAKRLLLSAAGLLVLLLACTFLLSPAETHCSRANGYTWSSHFMLKYVNGPPPT